MAQWLIMYRTVYIHIFNLQDGFPYGMPPSNTVVYEVPFGGRLTIEQLAVTRSRVMMRTSVWHGNWPNTRQVREMVVWVIETGDPVSTIWFWGGLPSLISPPQVLEVSTDDGSTSIRRVLHAATFLDEFRILGSCYDYLTSIPELVVFDTRIPQVHPECFRRFGLPPGYRSKITHINVDCNRPLGGTVTQEGPLIVDPTQAILVVETDRHYSLGTHGRLIVRINALIERECSARTDSLIPWEEWGEGSVYMEIPLEDIRFSTFVHRTNLVVVVLCVSRSVPDRLYTFDFSKRGCSALPHWGRMGGVGVRMSTLEDGRGLVLEGGQGPDSQMCLLGNGILVHLGSVSYQTRSTENDVIG